MKAIFQSDCDVFTLLLSVTRLNSSLTTSESPSCSRSLSTLHLLRFLKRIFSQFNRYFKVPKVLICMFQVSNDAEQFVISCHLCNTYGGGPYFFHFLLFNFLILSLSHFHISISLLAMQFADIFSWMRLMVNACFNF